MDTKALERFARAARRQLHEQVAAQLDAALGADSAALRGYATAISNLKHELRTTPRPAVIERVAYTWFNRFCALRFMDAVGATPLRLVSPADGFTLPEILQEAKAGVFDDELARTLDRKVVADLLAGRMRSGDPQGEAYRLLLVAACNAYHATMPFMFEPIADVTELLMPADLLSPNSALAAARAALTVEACQDVEVIGWLYQFYIAEKKEEVDAKVKGGGKVAPDELPAKTSLYTPHWIVRYLVENSLGRLWLLNRPTSRLAEHMPYYIQPEAAEAKVEAEVADTSASALASASTSASTFLRLASPEEIRLCDPACGSGHMLTYAFDLLYRIYEEEGYAPPDIPRLILEKNLFGMEIDGRSAALAAFALTMKARGRDRRFLRRRATPHICAYTPATVTEAELSSVAWFKALSKSLIDLPIRDALLHDLGLWAQIANIGSLLQPQLTLEQIETLQARIGGAGNLLDELANERVLGVLEQLAYLARKYCVVVANPPYLGGSMNEELKEFARDAYPDSKSDLFAMFIKRNLQLAVMRGYTAMITMQSWMFLSSYEALRAQLLNEKTIIAMAHLGPKAFDTIGGEVVSTTAFVIENDHRESFRGRYARLVDGGSEAEKERELLALLGQNNDGWHRASAADFKKIPGAPIAYWVSDRVRSLFATAPGLGSVASPRIGMRTGNNERFLRLWHEVDRRSRFVPAVDSMMERRDFRWLPYNKGGNYRKWYGNLDNVVDWEDEGHEIKANTLLNYPQLSWDNLGWKISNESSYFKEAVTWTDLSSSSFGVRFLPPGFIFDAAGPCLFGEKPLALLAYLTTKQCFSFLSILNPTLHFKNYNVSALPYYVPSEADRVESLAEQAVATTKNDWDSCETSWDFAHLPLLRPGFHRNTLTDTYAALHSHWRETTLEMQRLEEENNRIFIAAYSLQDELTPDVPLSEITLTCNPHYRYGGQGSGSRGQESVIRARWPEVCAGWAAGEEGLELRLLADTMREFISYAAGCMFGRYSLDKPGLILANQGETVADYVRIVGAGDPSTALRSAQDAGEQGGEGARTTQYALRSTFLPDKDNVIPILDGDWFSDDIVARFGRFLRVTFGDERYAENLAFIEAALGRDLRSFFVREFYDDHLKRYQRRPIYWLFSSPGGSFNALIYMHRYQPDTVSVVLNDYLREYQAKLAAARSDALHGSIAAGAANREKAAALKEVARLDKALKELAEYEAALLDLARKQVQIDLDDGVKVNYARFGAALRRVVGLNA